jgi:putative transposase
LAPLADQHQVHPKLTVEWKRQAPARWRGSFKRQGQWVNRNCVRRLMLKMELVPVYPRLNTSKPYPVHRVYSYLLHDVKITRPGRCGDVIYIFVASELYVPDYNNDWYSRRVLT